MVNRFNFLQDVAVKLFAYQDFSDDVVTSFKKEGSLNGRDRMQHGIERSPHPPVPHAASGQQGPRQPPSHLKPPGHGYLAHGPHLGESLQSHGPNQPGSQGEPLGPPINSAPSAHGPPVGQSVTRHLGPMEPDILADSHLPGDADMGPYGQPLGVDTRSMSITAATKHPSDSNQTSRAAAAKRKLTETPLDSSNQTPPSHSSRLKILYRNNFNIMSVRQVFNIQCRTCIKKHLTVGSIKHTPKRCPKTASVHVASDSAGPIKHTPKRRLKTASVPVAFDSDGLKILYRNNFNIMSVRQVFNIQCRTCIKKIFLGIRSLLKNHILSGSFHQLLELQGVWYHTMLKRKYLRSTFGVARRMGPHWSREELECLYAPYHGKNAWLMKKLLLVEDGGKEKLFHIRGACPKAMDTSEIISYLSIWHIQVELMQWQIPHQQPSYVLLVKKVMRKKSFETYEKRIQELTTQCQHKTNECYQAWMSLAAANDQLEKARMELDNRLFQAYSLATHIINARAKDAVAKIKGPLKDAVEILRTEIVDSGLLQDCLELGSSDLKGVIQILKDIAIQYSSTSHKNEL
ncbi:Kinesin-like protein KIFC3 [Artemisia annua]|uniref:Kinesin-like protein KIFC3 n=1 Tax=Artemisia annua TaxID=35608 RepID=A0A2U1PVW2_ARTAN|nr:Kinesin-like protein KIFC3 [Artemisia annua]